MAHPAREAICRCPQCRHYFCRECVTEHESQLLCSACLRMLLAAESAGAVATHAVRRWLGMPAIGAAAFLTAWLFFYCIGQIVLALAASSGSR